MQIPVSGMVKLLSMAWSAINAHGPTQMIGARLPDPSDPVAQLRHIWVHYMEWGTANPVRSRALAQLNVSNGITSRTRDRIKERSALAIDVVQRVSATGPFRDQPIDFVAGFFDALAGNTMDFMIAELSSRPPSAKPLCEDVRSARPQGKGQCQRLAQEFPKLRNRECLSPEQGMAFP